MRSMEGKFGDIDLDSEGPVAKFGGDFLRLPDREIRDGDARAFRDIAGDDGAADAARAARDQRDFIVEFRHGLLRLSVRI